MLNELYRGFSEELFEKQNVKSTANKNKKLNYCSNVDDDD